MLERAGGHWTLVDDGLRELARSTGAGSTGGGASPTATRLSVGHMLRVFASGPEVTLKSTQTMTQARPQLTEAQQRVPLALCRPDLSDPFGGPASNKEIADALLVSVRDRQERPARDVRSLRHWGRRSQNRKRAELACRAIERAPSALTAHQ